ncbi:hypothetical protein GGR04_004517 [Aureimonas pseudogalii]|uniref:Uncharacterized protein n=1 Tax=Aureimonas pseudogalii TaxID=1744844 RepID=A0A7W6H8U4_9HYPH|nr:hypothetical protein [Aureimonas pseudogalii]
MRPRSAGVAGTWLFNARRVRGWCAERTRGKSFQKAFPPRCSVPAFDGLDRA